jgi:hypothetical protein
MSASSLADLQRQFLGHLRGERNVGIFDEVSRGRMPDGVGLRIYTSAYSARLHEALEHDHPALGTYLGDELWDKMCRGYVLAHPSRCRSLRDFGTGLPAYLAEAEPFSGHPEIAELALFERRLLDSFDAADDEHAAWNQLLALPEAQWPALRLRFHPSLKFHCTDYNTVEIWRAIKNGQTPPPAIPVKTDWAIWRDFDRVSRFRSLDAVENSVIRHYLLDGDFVGMCNLLLAWHPPEAVPGVALGYLRAWYADGWVSRWMVAQPGRSD